MMNEVLYFSKPILQHWDEELFKEKGLHIDILRLDTIHPVIGGNKWMKLRLFLERAMAEKKGILTKGGPWSNHLHACAWACRQLGLPMHVWMKGNGKMQSAMLADVRAWGATVQFVHRNQFYGEPEASAFAAANHLLYIPMGGADEAGIHSSMQYLSHLDLPHYDYAVCAVGTATTLAALAFTQGNFPTVVGIDAGTNDSKLLHTVAQWQQQLPQKNLLLNKDYSFGGFARYTPELIHFANTLFRQQNIPTDIVYTAKLMWAVKDLEAKFFFKKGSTVMVVHSGGLQGNRSLPAGTLCF